LPLELIKISADETTLIADLANRIWHAYYSAFIDLHQIDYMLDKFYSKESLHKQIEDGQEFYKISEDDVVKGFISISCKSPEDYFIHKFYILSSEHGKSKGTEVMTMIKKLINQRNNGADTNVRLTVNRQNYKAINFYFKNHFTIETVEDFDIGNGYFMTDFVMLLKLRNS